MPVDPAALDARCLIVVDAAAKPGNYQDMRLAMMRGFFAGRVMARAGKQAGQAAVEQARKDMRDPALAPSQASCGAVLDGYLAQAYPG